MMVVGLSVTSSRYGLYDRDEGCSDRTTARVAKLWEDDEVPACPE
jgi:hypothetical protein